MFLINKQTITNKEAFHFQIATSFKKINIFNNIFLII